MANILDVAKRASVSKSTVSRVLNNNGYVARDTRDRIERVMKELRYTPSSFAQSIRTRKSRTIAMMIPDASNTFYMEIFKVVEDVMLKNNYLVILCDTRRTLKNEIKYAERLLKRSIDGLIYFTQQKMKENEEYFTALSKKLPFVFMDYAFAESGDINCVAMESRSCSSEAVEYLYGIGRRKIGYINLPKAKSVTLLRCEGYRQGLEKCGLPSDPGLVIVPREEKKQTLVDVGYAAAKELLGANQGVDAIMAASDHIAVGAIKYMKDKKIRVPEDVCVIGFDNIDLCEIVSPTLTTIQQPIADMGRNAAELLLSMIREEQPASNKIIYKGKMLERQSTLAARRH